MIENNLELILEELAGKNLLTIYHSTNNKKLAKMMGNDDFVPGAFGAGYMHGKGFYSVWKKEDLNNYGNYNYKGLVNLSTSKFLVLDPDFYKEILKKPISKNYISEQLKAVGISISEENAKSIPTYNKENDTINFGKISLKSKFFNSSRYLEELRENIPEIQKKFDGVVYRGEKDGHCFLMWNYRKVKILGKYSKRKDKTNLSIKNFKKQKANLFSNEALYSTKDIKLVERGGEYLFFEKASKKPVLVFSRDQKNDVNPFEAIIYLSQLEDFAKKWKIPSKIIDNLTFTNGKKIKELENLISINKKRNGFSPKEYHVENVIPIIEKSLSDGTFVEKLNKIERGSGKSPYGQLFLKVLFKEVRNKKENSEIILKMKEAIKKNTLIITMLDLLPKFLEECKNVKFDCQNRSTLNLMKKQDERLYSPEIKFKGKFINYKKLIKISLRDFDEILKMYNLPKDNYDLSSIFGEKTRFFIINMSYYDSPYVNYIKKSKNIFFEDPYLGYKHLFENLTKLPPSIFSDYDYNLYDREIHIEKRFTDVDFGNSQKTWILPTKNKKIFVSKNFNNKSLEELKKRNPNTIFLKES